MPETIASYIPDVEPAERALVVVNRDAPRPVQSMLEGLFADQPVAVSERALGDVGSNTVALVVDGDVVATSPLSALRDCVLTVNSDLYTSGARSLPDLDLPAVLDGLDDVPFSLRGFPASDTEKLLLVTVSRHVERLAWTAGAGTLRSSFQRLSRLDDERGTRDVYARVAEAGVDTHVYGVPDWTPPRDLDVTMHGGYGEDFRRAWFVVHVPADGDGEHAALVAYETGRNEWRGFWTYRPERVTAIDAYVAETM